MQMQAISSLLNKDDIQLIAAKAGNSPRTVESVLQYRRHTEVIQKLIIQQVINRWEEIGKNINAIQLNNQEFVTVKAYNENKLSAMWTQNKEYDRYTDIYLQLCLYTFKDLPDLWDKIKTEFSDIIILQYYCIDLLVRVLGIDAKTAVGFYNKNI